MNFIYVLMDEQQMKVPPVPIAYFTTLQKARDFALGYASTDGLYISEEKTNPTQEDEFSSIRFEVKI